MHSHSQSDYPPVQKLLFGSFVPFSWPLRYSFRGKARRSPGKSPPGNYAGFCDWLLSCHEFGFDDCVFHSLIHTDFASLSVISSSSLTESFPSRFVSKTLCVCPVKQCFHHHFYHLFTTCLETNRVPQLWYSNNLIHSLREYHESGNVSSLGGIHLGYFPIRPRQHVS